MSAIGVTISEARIEDAPGLAALVTQLGYPTTPAEMTGRLVRIVEDRDYVQLLALVVDEQRRTSGIGSELVAAVETWARSTNATFIVLTSGDHRTGSHRFYERLGYAATGKRFIKRLS